MALLDRANTSAFGDPVPTRVHTDIQKGPFIVVSGHDLEDPASAPRADRRKGRQHLYAQRDAAAHGYPGLNKYPHLAGNFGTAWQNQQKEFADLPAPILFTTNCIMPPRESYADRVYTTSVVGYRGCDILREDAQGRKDFSPIIEQALALGGYKTDRSMSGINGGHMLLPALPTRQSSRRRRRSSRPSKAVPSSTSFSSAAATVRTPGAITTHGVRQAHTDGHARPHPRLRQIPL